MTEPATPQEEPAGEPSPLESRQMSKTKITLEVTVETGVEPELRGPFATTRLTVTIGGVSAAQMAVPGHLGFAFECAYREACAEFTARTLETQ